MWDEDDTFGRWFQGLCAIPLLGWTCVAFYLLANGFHTGYSYVGGSCTGAGSAYLGYRCLRYAVTGRNKTSTAMTTTEATKPKSFASAGQEREENAAFNHSRRGYNWKRAPPIRVQR